MAYFSHVKIGQAGKHYLGLRVEQNNGDWSKASMTLDNWLKKKKKMISFWERRDKFLLLDPILRRAGEMVISYPKQGPEAEKSNEVFQIKFTEEQ